MSATLTTAEIEQQRLQFIQNTNDSLKQEWINGQIITHSPATSAHNTVVKNLALLLTAFAARYHAGYVGIEKVMIHLTENNYEPDICFFKNKTFPPNTNLFPAPDLAVEVLSDSTAGNDYGIKFKDYARHHVFEYWIINPKEEVIEQYQLIEDGYRLVRSYDIHDTVTSVLLPDFSFPAAALWDSQLAQQTASFIEYQQGKAEGIAEGMIIGEEKGRAEGRIEGIAEGIIIGKSEGIMIGEERKLTEIVLRMHDREMEVGLIAELTGLALGQVITIIQDQNQSMRK